MKTKIIIPFFILALIVGVSVVYLRGDLLQGFLSYKLTPIQAPTTPLKVDQRRIKLSPDIEVCDNGIDDNQNGKIDCLEGSCADACSNVAGKNVCLLDDVKENYVYTDSTKISQYKYTRMFPVKDEPTCKILTGQLYNKIAPTVNLKAENYPAYNKTSDDGKVTLICEAPCEVNSEVLNWRLAKINKLYLKLEKFVGTKIWNSTVKFYAGVLPENTDLSDLTPAGGGGKVFLYDAERFLKYKDTASLNQAKILHNDYPDAVYERTFENENNPVHELVHNIFSRYGSFSYNKIEEQFTAMIAPILGGASSDLKFPYGTVKPDSFCDPRFQYIGYPLLYHLCVEAGFDVDDLPKFFAKMDAFYTKKGSKMTDNELITIMSDTVGKDVSALFTKYDASN